MTTESAVAYIRRMREDAAFRQAMNGFDGGEAGWDYLRAQGFEFTLEEFKKAQDEIYREYGVTPM
ncbi:MAG: Nif11-like leader peptide family natural product precursor [Zoogloeaceae bacterium]|jgi:predicted ribosomally synthesized peptide with nif11-like leader|nr:Nif11-like leader peptide family natural product precursor [Zoogloeaceae bacterium]